MKSVSLLLVLCWVALSAAVEKTVLGKLGQVIETVPIYSKTDQRSRVYYRCKPYEYIVVRPTKYKAWLSVLLQNGRLGYVRSDNVAMLPYEVTANAPPRQARSGRPSAEGMLSSSSVFPPGSRAEAAQWSLRYTGVPYKWGGTSLQTGVDCSGYMLRVFEKIGLRLPRTAAEQVRVGQPVTRLEELQPGDRLYFWLKGKIGHTGIYVGNGYFSHASFSKGKIRTDYLGTKFWLSILVAARR